jgi:hypothetical protein
MVGRALEGSRRLVRLKTALMTAAALVAGASVVACQRAKPQVAALPLEMGAAAPLGEAPPPGGLPPAPPARIGTLTDYRDAYAYPDQAWGMSWAFGDSPPDYAFEDEGVTPWVWVADDDSECLAEPVPGGERYYYFEPGAYTPFYVQDPSYGYGFQNGQLVAIYARGGREIAPSADPAAAATAGQYLARGRLLRQAASSQPHQAVAAANWNARRSLISAEHASFAHDAARDPGWSAYHDQHQAQDQARFAAEATRRESWAAQTDSRLGQPGRAQREQRAAQSIAPGGAAMGGAALAARSPQRPGAVLNRYAAAEPSAGYEGRGRPGRAPRQAVNAAPTQRAFAPPPAERAQALRSQVPRSQAQGSQAMARAAAEQANDAAYQARAEAHAPARTAARAAAETQGHAAFAERHAAPPPPQAAAPRAFHAPAAAQPEVHAASPPQAAAQPHPAPQVRAAPPAEHGGGSDKHH